MAVKKVKVEEGKSMKELARKVALVYVGAFGMAADELGKLFDRLLVRGERMEKDVRKRVKRNDKQVRHLAHELDTERRGAVAQANKRVKKAVKKVEHALA